MEQKLIKSPLQRRISAICKRIMDIFGASALLVLLFPVMVICALGVKCSSPGSVIFRQQRVGYHNQVFCMYKFRSMCVNGETNTRWTTNQDERKTAFGAFLRKYSLDELPQLVNVLKGEMSLVGPRPEMPYFVEIFRDQIPNYMAKHQVRPGITGWAQIHGLRGDTSVQDRIRYDLYYIEHWSLLLDIRILWMTLIQGKFINNEQI